MCGLVSIVSKQKNGIFNQDMKIFTEMLFADQLRGGDGTGIIYNKYKEIKTLKGAMASSDFVNTAEYEKAQKEIILSANFVVGHNRSATKGKLSHENTHPFREQHITLVHNGTLPYHKNLADVEVDSQAIAISMAKIGYKKTIKMINGAFALIWVDNKQKTLNFVRNNQRPLWVIETDFIFIFVSEPGLAKWICERNNMSIISCTSVPIDTLHQFNLGEWDKMYVEKVDTYTPTFVPQTYNTNYHVPVTKKVTGEIVETNPIIGDTIKFHIMGIDADMKTKIIGEWEDKETGELTTVRVWAASEAIAAALVKGNEPLLGSISHIAYAPAIKERYFIINNAYLEEKQEKKNEYKSHNGITLTAKDISKVSGKCSCCNTKYSQAFLRDNMKDIKVHIMSPTQIDFDCPDCVKWLENEGTSYSQYGIGH